MSKYPLSAEDYQALDQCYISRSIADAAGIQRVPSIIGRQLVAHDQGPGDFTGLIFPYRQPGQTKAVTYRLRLDHPREVDGKERKYLAASGDRNHIYYPPCNVSLVSDPEIPLVIVEGEKKCLALWHMAQDPSAKPFLPIAFPGVWNFRGVIGKKTDANGHRVDEKGVLPDLDQVHWKGRKATILFDSNAASNWLVAAARDALTKELEARGAIVYQADLPSEKGINGPDDYLARHGVKALQQVIDKACLHKARTKAVKPPVAALALTAGLTIFNADYPDPQPIIEPILYPGLTVLGGRPKAGKSWLALQLAIAVISKGKLANYLEATRACRCLYLSLEDRPRQIRARLRKFTTGEVLADKINFAFEMEPLMPTGVARLDRTLTEQHYDLVILDSYYAAVQQASRSNLNIVQADYNTMKLIREVAEKHQMAILVVHHTRKATGGDMIDQLQGTTGTTAAPDAIWILQRTADGATLAVTGREVAPNTFGLEHPKDSPVWTITGEGDSVTQTDMRADILQLLHDRKALKPSTIAQYLHKPISTTNRQLKALLEAGLIKRNGFASYSLPGEDEPDEAYEERGQ